MTTRLEQIRERLAKAAPAPWTDKPSAVMVPGMPSARILGPRGSLRGGDLDCHPDDASFIAHAPADVALLVELADAVLEMLARDRDPDWFYTGNPLRDVLAKLQETAE